MIMLAFCLGTLWGFFLMPRVIVALRHAPAPRIRRHPRAGRVYGTVIGAHVIAPDCETRRQKFGDQWGAALYCYDTRCCRCYGIDADVCLRKPGTCNAEHITHAGREARG
jgi:hypothetical protein